MNTTLNPPLATQPSRVRIFATLLLTSLCVALGAAAVAALVSGVANTDFLLSFVYLRWLAVLLLLLIPIGWRRYSNRFSWTLPYVLRTPLTALFLTCESILVDIIIGQLH